MNAFLICPAPRPAVAALAEKAPLAALPLFGATVIEYWLVHLAGRGARQVSVLAADRAEELSRIVGDGARWGLTVEIVPTPAEPTVQETLARYGENAACAGNEPPAPDDIVLLDHFPSLAGADMFGSYERWFDAVQTWMPHALTPDRVGWREIKPGVHAGIRSHIPGDAILIPPCWIGEKVYLGPGVTIGPMAVVEDRTIVETGAEITRSIVGPETLVGRFTEIRESLAWGDTLIDWRTGSCLRVSDAFLLCPLREPPDRKPEAGVVRKQFSASGGKSNKEFVGRTIMIGAGNDAG